MRAFSVYLDGAKLPLSSRLQLHAVSRLSLYPSLQRLTLDELSPGTRALLLCGRVITVTVTDRSESVVASGTITDIIDDSTCGSRRTTVLFSPAPGFGASRVSLLLPAGITYREAIRRITASSSVPAAAGTCAGTDALLPSACPVRGPTVDVLTGLCDEIGVVPFLSGNAVCTVPLIPRQASLQIPPGDLYEASVIGRDLITLSAAPKGWPVGGTLMHEGRLRRVLRVTVDVDTSGDTVCELTLR